MSKDEIKPNATQPRHATSLRPDQFVLRIKYSFDNSDVLVGMNFYYFTVVAVKFHLRMQARNISGD